MAKKYQIPDSAMSDEIVVWGQHASCKGKPAEWWFTDTYQTLQGRLDTARAKSVCEVCIVRVNCLQYALDNDESYGIWGGLTPVERGYRRKGRARRVNSLPE